MTRHPARINARFLLVLSLLICFLSGTAVAGYRYRLRTTASAALENGKRLFAVGEWAQACRELKVYLERNPDDPEILLAYAQANMAVRPSDWPHIKSASAAYRRLWRQAPADTTRCRELVKVLWILNDYGQIVTVCRAWVQAAPRSPEPALHLARALSALNKQVEAQQALESIIQDHPDNVDAFILLSESHLQTRGVDGLDKAREYLDRAVSGNPTSAKAFASRAKFHQLHSRDLEAALADLESADKLNPKQPEVILLLFDLWLQRSAVDRAAKELETLCRLTPPDMAQSDIPPQNLRLIQLTAAAKMAMESGTADRKSRIADDARRELKDDQLIAFLPAAVELYLEDRRLEEARQCLHQYRSSVRSRGPEAPAVRARIALLEAMLAVNDPAGNPFEVASRLRPMIAEAPQHPKVWKTLIAAYERIGQSSLAIATLGDYVKQFPEDVEYTVKLARALLSRDSNTALEYAAQAERTNPLDPGAKLARIEAELAATTVGADAAQRVERINKELTELKAAHPQAARIHVLSAKLVSAQNTAAAMEQLEAVADRCDDPMLAWMQHYKYAKSIGQMDKALVSARRIVTLRPQLALARILLADVQEAMGDKSQARKTLETAAGELDGNERLTACAALAQFLIFNADRKQGLELLKQLARENPHNAQIRLGLLKLPEIQSDSGQAQLLVDEVRKIEGEKGSLWQVEQAAVWLRSERWRDHAAAIDDLLTRTLESGSLDVKAVLLMGDLCDRRADSARAEALYRRALQSNGSSMVLIQRLLSLLDRQNRYADVADVLKHIPVGEPAFADQRVAVAMLLNDYDTAEAELKEQMRLHPDDPACHVLMARLVYLNKHDAARALGMLETAEKLQPRFFPAFVCRLEILESEKRLEEAAALLDAEVARREDFASIQLRAEFQTRRHQPKLAEQDYLALTRIGESAGRAYRLLGQFYLEQNRLPDALAAWNAGLEIQPMDADLQQRLVRAMNDSGQAELQAQALKRLNQFLQGNHNEPGLKIAKAEALFFEGNDSALREAESILEELVRADPHNVQAHLLLIEIANQNETPSRANELINRALGANPKHVQLDCAQAAYQLRIGHLQSARRLAQLILQSNPDCRQARHLLVQALIDSNELDVAIQENASLLATDPHDVAAHVAQARILNRSGKRAEAIQALTRLDTSNTASTTDCVLALAELHRADGDYKQDDRLLERAEEIAARRPFRERAQVLLARLDSMQAQKRYDQIPGQVDRIDLPERDRAHVLAKAGLALMTSEQRQHWQVALEMFRRWADLSPDRVDPQLNLARASYRLQDLASTEQAYRKALAIEPGHAQATNDLAWIMGVVGDKTPEALEMASSALERHPHDAHLLDTRAALLIRLGRLPEAMEDLDRCLASPDVSANTRISALRQASRILTSMGQPALAARKLSEALDIDKRFDVLSQTDRTEIARTLKSLQDRPAQSELLVPG